MSSHEAQPPDVPNSPGARRTSDPEGGQAASDPNGVKAGKVIGVSVALSFLLAVMLLAFALPAANSGPDQLSVGVLQSQAKAMPTQAAGGESKPDIQTYADEAALRQAILDRDINGGFTVGRDGVTVFTATAGGAPAANAITRMGQAVAQQAGVEATVSDLVPFPEDDPQGAGLTAVALPMIIGGILPAIVFLRVFPEHGRLRLRFLGAGLFSLLGGVVVAAVLRFVVGTIEDDFLLVALGLALGMAALSFTFLGLEALLGLPGFGGGVALMMFLGNPLSGLPSGHQWLPGGWGTLGQLLPPGASSSLLRSTAYFDAAGATRPLIVLAAWVVLGVLLALLASRRTPQPAPTATQPLATT